MENTEPNFTIKLRVPMWGGRWDSNPRSPEPQSGALTGLSYIHHIGAPKGTRTPGLLLRRQLLYPAELLAHLLARTFLERVMGIEPTRPAWKAGVLPLNYTRTFCDGDYYSTLPPSRQEIFTDFSKNSKEKTWGRFSRSHVPLLISYWGKQFSFNSPSSMERFTPVKEPSPRSTSSMANLSSTMRRMLFRRSRAPLWP